MGASLVVFFLLLLGGTSFATDSQSSPAFMFWLLYVSPPTCNLSTGVCVMSMSNDGLNSSHDLALASDHCTFDLIYATTAHVPTTRR